MNRALLVGINQYPPQYPSLEGCVNDVTDMANFVVAKCGFAMDDVHLLTDTRATTATIKDRLTWLVGGVSAGDKLLFHYSGHGSQYADRDAQGAVSQLHDCICPYDFAFDPAHMLMDTDFQTIFSSVPSGVLFDWVSDSCHSGDLTRGISLNGRHSKHIQPPADIEWRIQTAKAKNLAPKGIVGPGSTLNVALIAGCTSEQESMDAVFNSRHNGALTYYLLVALNAPGGSAAILTALVNTIDTDLTADGFDQTPQVRGASALTGRPFLA